MPRGDRTGPEGLGPMTGRAAGYCAGFRHAGYASDGPGGYCHDYGRGYGRSYGHGYHWGYGARYWPAAGVPLPEESEKLFLEGEITYLEKRLQEVRKRLDDLKGTKKDNVS